MDYSKFKDITLEDTGLFFGNPRSDVVYKRLRDNGITNLKELFEKYDNNDIEYGINLTCNFYIEEIKGVIDLLRFQYLNIPLKFDPHKNLFNCLMEGESVRKIIQSCGISTAPAAHIEYIPYKLRNITLYDIFVYFKENNFYATGNYPKYRQKTFNKKIQIILEYCKLVELGVIKFSTDEKKKLTERELREQELTEVFNNANWSIYNDTQLLEDDKDVAIYAKYKRKIRKNIS